MHALFRKMVQILLKADASCNLNTFVEERKGYLFEIISDYFSNPDAEAIWITCINHDTPIAVA